jgi:ABC-3C protein
LLHYHDLSEDQFEQIVVALGQRLFGAGLIGFAKGKDGGKDAKFHGTAQSYPSTASPWTQCTIIQAKHTNGINASFSDKSFFNPEKDKGSLIVDELVRVKNMVESGELQNYLVISNRKLTGITEGKLKNYFHQATGIELEQLGFAGSDQLDQWFSLYPDAKEVLNFRPLDRPLIVSPDDLAITIEAFNDVLGEINVSDTQDLPSARTPFSEKNVLNNMSEDFAKILRQRYLSLTKQIDVFLEDPKNTDFQATYHEAAEEFSLKISEFQGEEDTFDSVFNYLIDLLIGRSPMLKSNTRLTRAMLFYMYWKCDIGKNGDA